MELAADDSNAIKRLQNITFAKDSKLGIKGEVNEE